MLKLMVRTSTYVALAILLVFVVSAVSISVLDDDTFLGPDFGLKTKTIDKVDSGLLERFAEVDKEEEVGVTLSLKKIGIERRSLENKDNVLEIVSQLSEEGYEINDYYYGSVSLSATEKQVRELVRDDRIESIQESFVFQGELQDSVNIVNAVGAWNHEVNEVGFDGTGKSICIVDSGIDFTHPDFAGKDIVGYNVDCRNANETLECVENTGLTDVNGHGTHVAGIAGANGGIQGIAKGADLIAVSVFNDVDQLPPNAATAEGLIRAIDWCADNKEQYNIGVISLSLGNGYPYYDTCDAVLPELAAAIDSATAQGIAVTAAAGNNAWTNAITLPACYTNAIAVSGTYKNDSRKYAYDEDTVKLFAPGVDINSTWTGNLACIGDDYCVISGTSMSTPMVSGAIVILQQALEFAGMPEMNPLEIEDLLFDAGDSVADLNFNLWRRINVGNVITEPPILVGSGPSFIDGRFFNNSNESSNPSSYSSVVFDCNAEDNIGLRNVKLKIWNNENRLVYSENQNIDANLSYNAEFNVPVSELTTVEQDVVSRIPAIPMLSENNGFVWSCFATDVLDNQGQTGYHFIAID